MIRVSTGLVWYSDGYKKNSPSEMVTCIETMTGFQLATYKE
jgi:hypothetical protein